MAQTTTPQSAKNTASKMHRRSRSGCFTCRLRRKKCDEGKPGCRACKHLGLKCEYKRPMWWSNNEQRRAQKEMIKNIIKKTKLTEKAAQQGVPMSATTPPSLCHSLPTSDTFSENLARTRAPSEDSQNSIDYGFNHPLSDPSMFSTGAMLPPQFPPSYQPYPAFSPYEVDIKTERQMFVNDVPTRRDSTISTFSTYQPLPLSSQSFGADTWVQQDYFESRRESFAEEPLDFNFFDFPHATFSPGHQVMIPVDDSDQYLLNHFLDNVVRLIFPILEANQHGSARSDLILPALESNKAYLHCCLMTAAQHLKATQGIEDPQIDQDIMRHRGEVISQLCNSMQNADHVQSLESTLAMIFFQCTVGRADDALPDISWHTHFTAAKDLVQMLELPQQLISLNQMPHSQPPFNMTLAAWIDILGATMLAQRPVFADTYREKLGAHSPSGLAELMGCDDSIMYVISEIACLEAIKQETNMDDISLCAHIKFLGEQINLTDPGQGVLANAYSTTGAIRPKQLSKNMSAVFRLSARIYLCSLVPEFDRHAPNVVHLVKSLTDAMEFIPAGPEGFDRSLVWPLLIAGSVATADSTFRTTFFERVSRLGEASDVGSFGRVKEILKDVWSINDNAFAKGERQSVHWRDVMRQKQWDFLLI